MTRDPPDTYGRVSRANHWITALFFLAMLGLGFTLSYAEFSRDTRAPLMLVHKATGVLLLGWAAWRVGWRIRNGFPSPPAPHPRWQIRLSKLVHVGLLTAILLMPFSGLMDSLLGGRDVDMYGLFVIPAIAESEPLEQLAERIHSVTAYTLAGLLVLHIGAALRHHLIDRDPTLLRMIKGAAPTPDAPRPEPARPLPEPSGV